MVNALAMRYAILLVASIVVLLDWLSYRNQRESRDRAA
jgi:hypothetical protein